MSRSDSPMTKTVGIVLFPDFEELDAMGPREVLGMMARITAGRWRVAIVSEDGAPVRGFLGTSIVADHSFADCPPLDVILVPGGTGTRTQVDNEKLIGFIRGAGASAEYVVSVCTGSFLLHRAGFLSGKRATTHWGSISDLKALGDVEVGEGERWVRDGNVITSAGISAGIDMSLYLVSQLTDRQTAANVQKMMEYYPQPPELAEARA
jgi:transcriptional regulator GlxA family with amidase domain